MTRSNMFKINLSDGYHKLLFHFLMEGAHFSITIAYGVHSKTCVKRHSQKAQNWFSRPISLNAGQKHYFRPSFSYHLSLRSFCLFLSGRFTQVLLFSDRHELEDLSTARLANSSFIV